MSEHRATVEWRPSGEFRYETYSRAHTLGALSACHMLRFLHLACRKKWGGEQYVDEAIDILDKTWMSRVTLRPRVTFSGPAPSAQEQLALHHAAHEKCFIANSVKTEVVIEPC